MHVESTGSLTNRSEERVWNRGMLSDAVLLWPEQAAWGAPRQRCHVLGLLSGTDSGGTFLSDHAVSQHPVS